MDWTLTFQVLSASSAVVAVAVCAAFVLVIDECTLRRWIPRFVSIAIGVLLGDAFLHLLPDAIDRSADPTDVLYWTLLGMLAFYAIEQFLFWRHDHSAGPGAGGERPRTYVRMNLLGDGIHNFVDGVLIAGSFLADPLLGFGATLAIVVHEIPQELSDIAVLIHGGVPKRRAVLLNVLCATTCIAGALATLVLARLIDLSLGALLSVTAGGFIYIAATDLIPLLRERPARVPLPLQLGATAIGVAAMQAILWLEAWR